MARFEGDPLHPNHKGVRPLLSISPSSSSSLVSRENVWAPDPAELFLPLSFPSQPFLLCQSLDLPPKEHVCTPRRLRLRTVSSRTGRSLAIESGLEPDDHDSCNGPAK